jgi:hypothetical protein
MDNHSGMILIGKTKELREKSIPVTLSTTNPIWTELGTNMGPRSESVVANHLSHGMAKLTPDFNTITGDHQCDFLCDCSSADRIYYIYQTVQKGSAV